MASSVVEEYPTADKLLEKITSTLKIERDVGMQTLIRLLKGLNCDEGERRHLLKLMRALVGSNLSELGQKECVRNGQLSEKKLGCLSAALVLLSGGTEADDDSKDSHQFALQIKPDVLNILFDHDVRVRLCAGETFGTICKLLGPSVYLESKDIILDLLDKEFQKNREIEGMFKSPETPIDPTGEVASSEPHATLSPQLGMSPVSTPLNPNIMLSEVLKEASNALHSPGLPGPADFGVSLGCAQLESSLKCIQFIAKGLGTQFGPLIDQNLLDLIFPALHHQNRFIRETGFYLCGTLLDSELDLKSMGKKLAEELTSGLEDFCSQSRIAAAVACRKFMVKVSLDATDLFNILLPRLCLCRYYMADTKFLLYSQESWKLIFATEGPQLVAKNIDDVVNYYFLATDSDNHAIREAACLCLGELSRKIDRTVVAPYSTAALETLKRSFHDERWHVRDAACLAAGSFFLSFPEESVGLLEQMFPLFFENLQYPISVVRQGAAAALANVVRAYGPAVLPRILEKICEGLAMVEQQTAENSTNADMPALSPEMKYSYPPTQGAIIPYARQSEPWEFGDGCLYLAGDISQIPLCQNELHALIPKIFAVTQHRSFSQHVNILETTCKIIPCLVKGIGKRQFKEFLSQFFEPIFYSIECDNSLTAGAGRACLKELCAIFGPNIIRSRVELFDPRFAHYVDEL